MTGTFLDLADGMDIADLSYPNLWASYYALGGDESRRNVRDHIATCRCTNVHEHNVIAQAINEYLFERGQDHPVGYRNLPSIDDLTSDNRR